MIVVGYSAATESVTALRWAVAEAVRRRTGLRVVNVVSVQGALTGAGIGPEILVPEAVDAARGILTDARDQVAFPPDLQVVESVELGSPAAVLVDASQEADLVVVGNRGHGEFASVVLGSVAYTVIAHAHCPVVVVRDAGECEMGAGHPVVVGVDGSETGARALDFAVETALRSGSPLHLVVAWQPQEAVGTPVDPWVVIGAEETLTELRSQLTEMIERTRREVLTGHPDLDVTAEVVEGRPSEVLANHSDQAGLVVVGSRGRGGFRGLLLGSVSHELIHRAHCPIAVVR